MKESKPLHEPAVHTPSTDFPCESLESVSSDNPIKQPSVIIHLTSNSTLDLSSISDTNMQDAIIEHHATSVLEMNKKGSEMSVDSNALRKTLEDMAETTNRVSKEGNAITISHTQDTSVGRTEIMMGNTHKAQQGKLSLSQVGLKDWRPLYVVCGVIIAMVTLIMLMGNGQ